MKRLTVYNICVLLAGCLLLLPAQLDARPLDFNEVSLLVRVREPEAAIREEVGRRKLLRQFTPEQEATLKKQGASDSLVQALRNNNVIASKDEVAVAEAQQQRLAAVHAEMVAQPTGPEVHVFNVAFGHPINLSQWGGSDYEFAIYSYRVAGEDHIQAAQIDNVRTGTDVSRTIPLLSEGETYASDFFPTNEVRNWRFTPYDARGDLRDNRFNFSDSVATTSRSFTRPMRIDWDSPVFIQGQPYTFYRIYGAGGVALYYIGRASDRAAMVAVVSNR